MNAIRQPALAFGGELLVTGMTCAGCANPGTRSLARVSCLTSVAVDFDTALVRAAETASIQSLIAAIEKTGYGARLAPNGETKA